jgi:hypothetical protein
MQSINLRARTWRAPSRSTFGPAVLEWWLRSSTCRVNTTCRASRTPPAGDRPARPGRPPHELELRRLALHGEWVSREALYLGILATWLLGALGAVVWRLAALRRQHRRQEREIEALVARAMRLHAEKDDLRRQATIDELTGVLNRRGVEQAIADLGERGAGMTIILMDVDHFKRVNDTHGHDGDQVPRAAAVMMQNSRRRHPRPLGR